MNGSVSEQRIRFAVTPSAFDRDEVEEALATFRAEFSVDEIELQRGGPDFFLILLEIGYPFLMSIAANLATGPLGTGLKRLWSKWRPKPSHYRPGKMADLGTEFSISDEDLLHVANIRSADPEIVEAALGGLPNALRPYHQDGRQAQVYYDLAKRRYMEIPFDPNRG